MAEEEDLIYDGEEGDFGYPDAEEGEIINRDEVPLVYEQGTEVFVGGLTPHVKTTELKQIFGRCGEVVDVKMVKDKLTHHPKGYAFVRFRSKEEAAKAQLELTGYSLNGKSLIVNPCEDNRKVVVSNADASWTQEIFKNHVEEAVRPYKGVVLIEVKDGSEAEDGSDESRCYIYFESNQTARYFMQNVGQFMAGGKELKVEWDGKSGNGSSEAFDHRKTVYLCKLPLDITKDTVEKQFNKYGTVTKVWIAFVDGQALKIKGKNDYGFVSMESEAVALKAIEGEKNWEVNGERIDVSQAKPRREKRPMLGAGGLRGGRRGGARGGGMMRGGRGARGGRGFQSLPPTDRPPRLFRYGDSAPQAGRGVAGIGSFGGRQRGPRPGPPVGAPPPVAVHYEDRKRSRSAGAYAVDYHEAPIKRRAIGPPEQPPLPYAPEPPLRRKYEPFPPQPSGPPPPHYADSPGPPPGRHNTYRSHSPPPPRSGRYDGGGASAYQHREPRVPAAAPPAVDYRARHDPYYASRDVGPPRYEGEGRHVYEAYPPPPSAPQPQQHHHHHHHQAPPPAQYAPPPTHHYQEQEPGPAHSTSSYGYDYYPPPQEARPPPSSSSASATKAPRLMPPGMGGGAGGAAAAAPAGRRKLVPPGAAEASTAGRAHHAPPPTSSASGPYYSQAPPVHDSSSSYYDTGYSYQQAPPPEPAPPPYDYQPPQHQHYPPPPATYADSAPYPTQPSHQQHAPVPAPGPVGPRGGRGAGRGRGTRGRGTGAAAGGLARYPQPGDRPYDFLRHA